MATFRRPVNPELRRLKSHANGKSNWKHWGPYLAERAWGTVREDYGHDGNAWTYFPHEHARSRTYRWNEDALAGFCDRNQYLCFGLALWNGVDPYLKERLFGLSGPEGNHGEDVKELYWYEDSTPTHSYASMRYHYPHAEFPYEQLRAENAVRGYADKEYEISDTGIFSQGHYHDVKVTYAKVSEDDLLIRLLITNRSNKRAELTVLPQLWFRNTWSWGYDKGPMGDQPSMPVISQSAPNRLTAEHPALGNYQFYWQANPDVMMTNNETNREALFGKPNNNPYVKDAFHRYIVDGQKDAINPDLTGTKAGVRYKLTLTSGASRSLQFRLCKQTPAKPFLGFKPKMDRRMAEAERFYNAIQPASLDDEPRQIQRQALAGMLWSKQLYYYDIEQWYEGDPGHPVVRNHERNQHWQHMHNFDVMSMPDKWEYPWYAVWDTAFHTLPLAMVDADYAKRQLTLLTREWYMHPNGQLPAYEWAYGDVNPPVHAWAALNVYRMDEKQQANADSAFLEAIFQKLLLNFTWWVNQKDTQGNSIFEGGFLGLDNISLFDRSLAPPTGGVLNQSDGTAWMGFYCKSMLDMSLTLAEKNPVYQSIASKFVEHYLRIANAINGDEIHTGLWDREDGFFYDRLDLPDGSHQAIKVRSLVGLMPLIAVSIIEDDVYRKFPDFSRRLHWVIEHKPRLAQSVANMETTGKHNRHLLSFLNTEQLRSVLTYLLDEDEFLSEFGIRSLSRYHAENPVSWTTDSGDTLSIGYEPGEGQTNLFGGNSNWRGPIWFPINYLIIESLRRYHAFYGDDLTIECPTDSGQLMNLDEVALFLSRRLISLFEPRQPGELHNGQSNEQKTRQQPRQQGKRPWCGNNEDLHRAAEEGLHQYFEYFNGDTGEGLGASHQTGWTGLVAMLQQQCAGTDN